MLIVFIDNLVAEGHLMAYRVYSMHSKWTYIVLIGCYETTQQKSCALNFWNHGNCQGVASGDCPAYIEVVEKNGVPNSNWMGMKGNFQR